MLLTISDVADQLQVSKKTVRRWIADGRLPAIRLGPTLIRIDASSVEALRSPIPSAGNTGPGRTQVHRRLGT